MIVIVSFLFEANCQVDCILGKGTTYIDDQRVTMLAYVNKGAGLQIMVRVGDDDDDDDDAMTDTRIVSI